MDVALLVPVKAFTHAKQRLASVLQPDERARLARWMAARVLASADGLPIFVACDDEDVRAWAEQQGAAVLWSEGLGLNGAVDDGVAAIGAAGYDHVIVSHADLPLPRHLPDVARPCTTTLVPDRRRDGTNVMSFPIERPVTASYGPGSFARHIAGAGAAIVEVRGDSELSIDIDTATDLTHPLLREVLPPWLPTIQANRFTHRSR